MANTNGKTTFCPGCPNVGNFVGEILPESFEITSTTPIENALLPSSSPILKLIDKDGMESIQVFGTPVSISAIKARTDRLSDRGPESVYLRISQCVGTTAIVRGVAGNYRTEFDCPALNKDVINKLSQPEQEQ